MTRRRTKASLASKPPLVSGNTLWTLKALAEGGTLVGEPKGLNPRGATPWTYTARSKDGRESWDVKTGVVTDLTLAGILKGRAESDGGKPTIRYRMTDIGLQALAQAEAAGGPSTGTTTRGAR